MVSSAFFEPSCCIRCGSSSETATRGFACLAAVQGGGVGGRRRGGGRHQVAVEAHEHPAPDGGRGERAPPVGARLAGRHAVAVAQVEEDLREHQVGQPVPARRAGVVGGGAGAGLAPRRHLAPWLCCLRDVSRVRPLRPSPGSSRSGHAHALRRARSLREPRRHGDATHRNLQLEISLRFYSRRKVKERKVYMK
ncbi:Protein of unknown function [Gryllus bimaculatus]|nr:Protein of unknown function [Gryllus bimaculatus]